MIFTSMLSVRVSRVRIVVSELIDTDAMSSRGLVSWKNPRSSQTEGIHAAHSVRMRLQLRYRCPFAFPALHSPGKVQPVTRVQILAIELETTGGQ